MMDVFCLCGSRIELPEDFVGELAECPECRRTLRVVAAAAVGADGIELSGARLVIRKGPNRIGEQLVLAGTGPIEVGKLPERAISLPGGLVSRNHCRLVKRAGDWQIEDSGSTNGTYVGGVRITSHDLSEGEIARIGDYELEYTTGTERLANPPTEQSDDALYELMEEPLAPPPRPSVSVAAESSLLAAGPGPTCPSCGKTLTARAKICIDCGINVQSGRPLLIARAVDENVLHVNTQTAVRAISWLIPFGLYPVASEGFGTRRPYVIWGIAALTVVASVLFWVGSLAGQQGLNGTKELMLWGGREPTAKDILVGYNVRGLGNRAAFLEKLEGLNAKVPEAQRIETAYRQLDPEDRCFGEFHWWQLVTHALLHGGILHLAGNLVFLMVFGSRVNALIGALKTGVLYPLLAVVAGLAYMAAEADSRPMPMLGASGAIMGLAGMYFVLFPIHRVHMVIWLRLGLLTGFRMLWKIFAVRGFWVVLFYLAFDVLATLLGRKDGVAHWAHLGGFAGGAAAALILLMARQIDARGTDLLSVLLGRHAWVLLGKPAQRVHPAPVAAAG